MHSRTGAASRTFRPLLKWPGGKSREWTSIAPHLPATIGAFADPFCGGLAPFAKTPFRGRAFLNDAHPQLIDLYRRAAACDPDLRRAADALAAAWDAMDAVTDVAASSFAQAVRSARSGGRPEARDFREAAAAAAAHAPGAGRFVSESLASKSRRVAALERKHDVAFDGAAVATHGATAVRAGFYTFVRDREPRGEGAARTADFWFVREFCYGSMFRHNKQGVFNIPYGGTSYDGSRFADRAARLRDAETIRALGAAEIHCGDFAPFLARVSPELSSDGFVFADPPYDSEFKSYGHDAFSRDDHERLAASLAALPCRSMLVIQETPFVRATYLSPAMTRRGAREAALFGKTYGYNVRGRNVRAARHLVVVNYGPEECERCE